MTTAFDTSATYTPNLKLTGFSTFIGNDLENSFVARWAAPPMLVDKPVFEYYEWGRQHQMLIGNTLRPEGSEGALVRFGFTSAAGRADEYAIAAEFPRARTQFADAAIDLTPQIARFLRELKLIDIEARFRDLVTVAASHNGGSNAVTLSGTDQWSDYINSDPMGDVAGWRETVRAASNRYPNIGWMSPLVYEILCLHPQILNSLKYVGTTRASLQQIADFFRIPQLRIASAQYVSSVYGATATGVDIWGKDFFMAYSDGAAGLMSQPWGWHASRPLEGYPNLREVSESMYDSKKVMDYHRIRYSDTFNSVTMGEGTTFYAKNVIA